MTDDPDNRDPMQLHYLFKDPGSLSDNCLAAYDAQRDGVPGLVVQGKGLRSAERAQLVNRAPDEDGVWISDVMGRRIAQYYNDQG